MSHRRAGPLLREAELSEFEIKLHVPDESLAGVRAAVSRGAATTPRLRARYFDTGDGRLAAARIALRVRQEGRRWVQTAKAAGDNVLHRLEEEVALEPGEPPQPVLRRHAGTPLGERLAQVLGGDGARADAQLVELYRTDVSRTTRVVTTGTTTIELALDVGRIACGRRGVRVQELELELKSGSRAAAIELAQQWCERHGLWLDTLSKAERGQRLARAAEPVAAVGFQAPALRKTMDSAALLRAVVGSALDQVLAHASELAAGSQDAEQVHQLRIGLRRLRTAAREFAGLEAFVDDAQLQVISQAFRALGAQRDLTLVQPQLVAQMRAAGGPALALEDAQAPEPAAVVRSQDLQAVLLHLLGWLSEDAPAALDAKHTRRGVERRLNKLLRRTLRDASAFGQLPVLEQHALRKRFKRLRYLGEFVATLYPRGRHQTFIDELKPVQEALGALQDLRTAAAFWSERTGRDPQAWFAVGWLRAREAAACAASEAALRRFAKRVRPFWA
jgi:inorganic triphosphatase YgiF